MNAGERSPMRSARLGLVAVAMLASACSLGTSATPIPAPTATPTTPAALARYYDQQVRWTDCGEGAQCAQVTVPLDYAHPDQATTTLAVTRVPATGESLGSLFVNPGGPGGSGFDYARGAAQVLDDAVREHYDIVGVDPRGVAKSDPVECLTNAQRDAFAAADVNPVDAAGVTALVDASRVPSRGCMKDAAPRFAFMGTPNVARDLDIVRAVVGDPSFNYLGKSYGTAIGAMYARLFPERVGRMVLDGVLPTDRTLDDVTRTQAAAFEASLHDFAADCATHDDCPFTGDADAVVAQVRALLARLRIKPLSAGSRQLTSTLAQSAILSFLYFPASDYPRLRSALAAAVRQDDGRPLLSLLDERMGRRADGTYADNSLDAYYAVTCADRQYTTTPARTAALAKSWSVVAPTFGEGLAWGLLPCSDWPAQRTEQVNADRYSGAPVLVVSTLHDPATPATWGVDLARQLGRASLITWDAYNHTAYHQGSSCIDDAVDAYLLQGVVPAANATCPRHT